MMTDKPIADRRRWCAAAGFTLLEVTIAIAIMATILVILYGDVSCDIRHRARKRPPRKPETVPTAEPSFGP